MPTFGSGVSSVVLRSGAVIVLVVTAVWSELGCGGSRYLDPGGGGGAGGGGEPATSPLFVAVGAKGAIVTSPDGIAWSARSSGVTAALSSVAAGPSRLVAVGSEGTILKSRDGIVWERAASPTTSQLRDVIFAGDRFVAVGEDWTTGAVTVTSADGVTWIAIESPSNYMFHGIAHRGGNLIAAAYYRSDLSTPAQFHASVGGAWTQREGPDFYKSLELPGMIVVTGGGPWVSVSMDNGTSWERHALDDTGIVFDLAFDGATFVAVGDMATFTSSDGRAWTKWKNPPGSEGGFYGAAHGLGTFVAVGSSGRIASSPDGVAWTAYLSPTREHLVGVAYGPTR